MSHFAPAGSWRRKAFLPGVLALVVLIIACVFFISATKDDKTIRYDTVRADRGDISAKVTATGSLSALVTVEVGSQVSGRLKEIAVDYNSVVEKGQVLAKIDPQLFEAALGQSQANYEAAKANLFKAEVQLQKSEKEYQRSKELAEKNLISQSDMETAEATRNGDVAQVDVQKAYLSQAAASLHQAKVNLGYTTITSPINGIVIKRSVDVGQTVAAAYQAPVLFTIAEDLRRMQVDTNVSEADVGKLSQGMSAYFTVDAYPGDTFKGTIRQVRNAAQVSSNVVTYDAVIDVENQDLKLKPGMTASVTFVYSEAKQVLRVPSAALRFKPKTAASEGSGGSVPSSQAKKHGESAKNQNNRTLWTLENDKAAPRNVVIGLSDGSLVEIVGGDLKEGDAVITGTLSDAAKSKTASQGKSSSNRPPPPPF